MSRSVEVRKSKSISSAHCLGCKDDFYNGKNNIGVKECWCLKSAKLIPTVLIHVSDPPPYKGLKPKKRPNCYKANRFVTVSPDRIGKDGYWK